MNIKGAVITCVIVVLYLSLCSWRFEELEKIENGNDGKLVLNVK